MADVAVGRQKNQLKPPLQFLRTAQILFVSDHHLRAEFCGNKRNVRHRKLFQFLRAVHLLALIVEQKKAAVLGDRDKGKQPGDLGDGNASQQNPYALLLMRAGIGAVLKLAGKAEARLLLIHKNILSASALQRFLIPFLVSHLLPAEYVADIGDRVIGKKQIADGKLRIHIQLHLKSIVQKQRLCVKLRGQAVVERILRIQIHQLILPDGSAQQDSKLFIAGIFVGKLIHRLRKNAAQADVRLHNRGL